MVIVDSKKTLGDISRLIRTIGTYLVFLALGFLLCYYLNVSKTVQSIIDRPISCISGPPIIIKCDLPRSGV